MNQTFDLFPASLLVTQDGDRIYTTSLSIAQYSKKLHKNVLQVIERRLEVLPSRFAELNFELSKCIISGGKNSKRESPMWKMSEEGFALTMMGFTGKDAVQWQVDFIEAFIAQRAQLQAETARYAAVVDYVRPYLRPVVEGTQAGLSRAAIAGPLGKSCASITYHRRQGKSLGLLLAGGAA